MTKPKTTTGKKVVATKSAKPEPAKKTLKKSYNEDDEDEDIDLDENDDLEDDSLDEDMDDAELVIPKTFDPFVEDDEDDDDDF